MIASPVLVTGGAGFIGSHLVEALLARGATVRVLDSLEPQVHGVGATRARHLPAGVELVHASVCDGAAVDRALAGVGSVVHLAAQVGVGQSMYAIVPVGPACEPAACRALDPSLNAANTPAMLPAATVSANVIVNTRVLRARRRPR